MSVITVNAIGDTCPVPVIKAKQALAQMTEPGDLVVLVDNEVAVQNLTRMGASQGYAVQSEKTGDGNFQVRILVNALPQPEESAPDAACIPDARGDLVVAVDSAHMGRGSEELGATLMKGFLFAVGQLPRLPSTVLFYNGGGRDGGVGGDGPLQDLPLLGEGAPGHAAAGGDGPGNGDEPSRPWGLWADAGRISAATP